MDFSDWMAGTATTVSVISVVVATLAWLNANRLQSEQWRRDELTLRRDVLRRLVGYRYRLTESLKGRDGEPFIAMNEVMVVYADFPQVIESLLTLHRELEVEGRLSDNLVSLVQAMAHASQVPTDGMEKILERPLTPPEIQTPLR